MDTDLLQSNPKQVAANRKHKSQAFWQILFPVLLLSLVVIALAVFMILTTGGPGIDTDTHWANISLIWLILPALAVCLVFLGIVGGLVYLFSKLLNKMPGWMAKLQYYAERSNQVACSVGDKIVSPIMKVNSVRAGWRGFLANIRQGRSAKNI